MECAILHLGACVWSACGKDPGFTPDLMLEMISRNARVTPDLLAELKLKTTLDPRALKVKWNETLGQAYTLVDKFRAEELGCLYVLKNGEVPKVPKRGDRPHFGSVRGAWPKVVE